MNWVSGKLCALLSVAILVLGMAACAANSTTAMWSPGQPDAMTTEHYNLVVAAIDKRAKTDAQAALHLLRDDVSRMRTNTPSKMAALAQLYGVSNEVDAGNWEKARAGILELSSSYGHQ